MSNKSENEYVIGMIKKDLDGNAGEKEAKQQKILSEMKAKLEQIEDENKREAMSNVFKKYGLDNDTARNPLCVTRALLQAEKELEQQAQKIKELEYKHAEAVDAAHTAALLAMKLEQSQSQIAVEAIEQAHLPDSDKVLVDREKLKELWHMAETYPVLKYEIEALLSTQEDKT